MSSSSTQGFGATPFAAGATLRIQQALGSNLPKELIASRPAPGGGKVAYVEAHHTFNFANDIFGFNGWSCHIEELKQEYVDKDDRGRFSASASAVVRVVLRDGTSHMDVGCGTAEGQRSRHEAIKKSKKDAVTDARKRCLRVFGAGLGNCVRDKAYQAYLKTSNPLPSATHHPVRTRPHEPYVPAAAAAQPRLHQQPPQPEQQAAQPQPQQHQQPQPQQQQQPQMQQPQQQHPQPQQQQAQQQQMRQQMRQQQQMQQQQAQLKQVMQQKQAKAAQEAAVAKARESAAVQQPPHQHPLKQVQPQPQAAQPAQPRFRKFTPEQQP